MSLPHAIANLENIFDREDFDSDGNLDRDEIYAALGDLGIPCSERDIDTLLERSHRGGLHKHEFIAFCVLKELQFYKVFHRFDRDRNGSVSFAEFSAGMAELHLNASSEEKKALFDGAAPAAQELGYRDFRRLLANVPRHMHEWTDAFHLTEVAYFDFLGDAC